MKTSRLTYALLGAGIVAGVVAVLANVHTEIGMAPVAGFALVAGLIGLVAVEYGIGTGRDLRR